MNQLSARAISEGSAAREQIASRQSATGCRRCRAQILFLKKAFAVSMRSGDRSHVWPGQAPKHQGPYRTPSYQPIHNSLTFGARAANIRARVAPEFVRILDRSAASRHRMGRPPHTAGSKRNQFLWTDCHFVIARLSCRLYFLLTGARPLPRHASRQKRTTSERRYKHHRPS